MIHDSKKTTLEVTHEINAHEVLKPSEELTGKDLNNLELLLTTTSMNHEYARKEFEKSDSYARQQELLSKMSQLKNLYFIAREKLARFHPEKLGKIEGDLQKQKSEIFTEYVM